MSDLDTWAAALADRRDAAITTTSEVLRRRYMHYLTNVRISFVAASPEVAQFTFDKRNQ